MELIDDDELTAEAMAAQLDAPLDDDAVSLWAVQTDEPPLLPEWYMPPPMAGGPRLRGWKRRVAWMVVISFLAINAAGLCSTYGWVGLG